MRRSTFAYALTLFTVFAGAALAETRFGNDRAAVSLQMDDHGASQVFRPLQRSEQQAVVADVTYAYGYVHAINGAEYSISVNNRTNGRVLACMAVDGRSVIDGAKISSDLHVKWNWSGGNCYIVSAHAHLEIKGWRESSSSVRRFFFTSKEESLASWKWDDRSAVSTIAVAIFPEVSKVIAMRPRGEPQTRSQGRSQGLGTGAGDRTESRVEEVEFVAETLASDVYILRYATETALRKAGLWVGEDGTATGDFGRYSKPKKFIEFKN